MNLKDSYLHGTDLIALIRALKWDGGVLKYLSASTSTDWISVGTIPTWNQDTTGKAATAGTADKVKNSLTFTGGVTETWDGSSAKTIAIPTKSSWNYDDRYLKLIGNETTNPLTGSIYINNVNGIILNSNNKDLNIWEVRPKWLSTFGFNLQYAGTGSGNDNDLVLWAHNQTGTHVESYRIKQDGTFIFKTAPKVGTNIMYHAGNLTIKTLMGTTAIGDADEPVYWNGSSFVKAGAYPTKASWNYDDRYLKLSGGTLSGEITFKYGSNKTDQFIQFSSTDSNDPQTVYLGIRRPVSSYGLCYKDNNGNLYDIIHSGNYTTYTVKKDGTGATGTWGIDITGNAATATKANSIATEQGTSNVYRNVFFAYNGDKTKVVYDDDFMYNPNTNTLKIGAGTLTATNYSGNAATATTATTATKIGTSTVGSTTMPVYIKSGAPTAITSFPEAYLSWGGTNTSGSVTPIGMTLSSEHSANRLAFINGNALTFEYSSDAGSTWTDYGYTASIKSQVFTKSYNVPIGRANGSTEYTTNSRTRITLTAQDGTNGYVYTNPRKMLINISSVGGMQVIIEYRTGTNYKNNGAWTTFGTYTLSGFSGWNDIPLILNTLGGGSTQTSNNWQLRLTFIMTSKYANYPTSASVNCIRIFGENAWTSPSTMAATGHLYSFDQSQNATFPAAITSTMFKKSGGTSAQFLKADGSVDSNTYSKSDHKHSFSDITPGVATIGDGANRLMFRTNSNYKNGIYYSTPGNEALVFGTITPITSWIFATTDPTTQTAWTSLTPSLQIKNGRVTINKLIANNTDASYNLDVNGSANATTLYENGVRVSVSGHTHDDRYYTESEVNNLLANKSNTSHTHSYIVTQEDNRSTATKPSDYNNRITFTGLKYNSAVGNPSSTIYNYVVGLRGWSDTSGGKAHELAFNNNGVFHRIGATDTWEAWAMMLTTSNYNSYAPSLTGSGASGTWGISITGNAKTATKLHTARTIWGQSFDGTGKVSGSLTEVTDITASGNVSCSNLILPLGGKIYNGKNYGLYISGSAGDYGSAIYLTHDHGKNQTAFRIHSHYDLNLGGLSIGFSTTTQNYGASPIDATYADILHIRGNGNIGIGTTSPSYKLHVVGDIYTTTGFKKEGSSDSYVLLGGGGHKLISAFSMTHDHPYLPLSGGTMSNTNVVTNLNADLLDGQHASYFHIKTARSYNSVDALPTDSDGWYNIFTLFDNVDGAVICTIKAYAHSSLTFIASKGHAATVTLQILQYNGSGNGEYFYIKGVRIAEGGKIQALFNKTSGTSKNIRVSINIFSSHGTLRPNETLTLETGNPTIIAGPLNGTHGKITSDIIGNLTGNASTATSATTSTYTSNVGSSGTAGTNYVTASKVISACNWYDTMIGSDSDTVINRWSEIVSFVAGFKETPDLATFLSNNYLAKAGGTMTGTLKWTDQNALPNNSNPQYFLCIDSFATGGTTKYATKADTLKALTGLTSTAIGDSDEPVYWDGSKFVKAEAYPTKASWNYDDIYLKLSGGTITGTLNINRDAAAIHYNNSSGVSQGWLGFSAADTPTVWMADGSTKYNLIHSGNIGSLSVSHATKSDYLTTRYIGSNGDTIAQVKLKILDSYTSLSSKQGYSILVNSEFMNKYPLDDYIISPNGIYSLTYLTPGYDGKSYGQWLASCLGSMRLYVFGRSNYLWTERKTIAWTSDIPTKVSQLTNDAGYVTTDTTYSTATANTLGLVKIGYTANGKNYPVLLSNGQMYVNVPWTDTNTTYNFSGTSFTSGNSSIGEHNANNITSNGHWYYTSNGPLTSIGASTNDGALYSQAYSDIWVAQIAQDYRNGRLFVRGKNNGTWQDWKRIAITGESQPANGGNADTVDGKHASAFAHVGAHNNLMASSNEFTFASSGFSGLIYINYRTAGGANGNITDYLLGNGKGGTLGTIIHSGNYNSYSPTLTGTGASGTWNININGTAAYATSAGDANTLDGKHASDFSLSTHTHNYIAKLRRLNEVFEHSSIVSGTFSPAIFELKNAGYPVYTDPEFASGNNSISVYNNKGNEMVTITREQAGDHANSSGFQLKIVTIGEATPECGGFIQPILSRANAIFVQIFRAKIPVGYNVNVASNPMGANYQDRFITDRAGTGKWEWYVRVVYCGASGSFSVGGHVYLSATSGYSSTSVTWYLSYCNLIDITKGAYDGLRTRFANSADSIVWSGITNKPNFVNSFGTKTGDITIRGGQTGNGSVNLAMSNNELLASIVGLGSNAYTSTAYLPLAGGTMTGLLTTTSANNHKGIKVGNTYINAINGELIFQNNSAIRFGGDSWNYNVWAGLKYVHSSKIVYLGLADGSSFTANNAQSGGKLYLPGIDNLYTGNGTNLIWHAGNDGSGSGLDADLLDGKHASAFATSDHNHDSIYVAIAGNQIIAGNKTFSGTTSLSIAEIDSLTTGNLVNQGSASLGTITSGIWNASTIAADYLPLGGTDSGTKRWVKKDTTTGLLYIDLRNDIQTLPTGNKAYLTYIGALSSSNNNKSNGATTNGNTYMKIFEDNILKNQYKISGSGSVSVASDANGNITITGTTYTNNVSTPNEAIAFAAANYNLSSASWTSATSLTSYSGTFAIQIKDTNSTTNKTNYYSGIIMLNGSTGRTAVEEIPLSALMATGSDTEVPTRIYAGIQLGVLKLSSQDASAVAHNITVKILKLIAL